MKIYKLKHIPTGLYYQPHKHRGSNLSKKGKIYQTSLNGLSSAIRNKSIIFTVYCEKDSIIHKITKDILNWVETLSYNQIKAQTLITDWEIEYLQ